MPLKCDATSESVLPVAEDKVRVLWVEAMVEPLAGDSEIKLAASSWLSPAAALGTIPVMRRAIARWRTADRRKYRLGPMFWLIGLLFFSLLFLPDGGVLRYSGIFDLADYGLLGFRRPAIERREWPFSASTDQRTAEQKRFFGGRFTSSSQIAWNLWSSDSQNPIFYAEYVRELRSELPPDYEEVVARIDSDNSWFDYFAAVKAEMNLVDQVFTGSADETIPPEFQIHDQAAFDQALEKIRGARGKKRYNSYSNALNRLRIPHLPQNSYDDLRLSRSLLRNSAGMYRVAEIMAAGLRQLAEARDVESFRELREDALIFLQAMLESEEFTIEGEFDLRHCYRIVIPELDHSAKLLGIDKERPDISRWRKMVDSDWKAYFGKPPGADADRMETLIETRASVDFIGHHHRLVALSHVTEIPREILPEELTPGRMDDFTLYSAKLCWAAFLATAAGSVAVWAFRWRVADVCRACGSRVVSLLGPADWAWILGVGVLMPFLFLGNLFCLTPLGGKDTGLGIWLHARPAQVPMGIHAAAFFLMLILPVHMARRRLAIHVDGLEISWKSPMGWAVAALVFLSVFVFPAPWAKWYGSIGLALGLVWLVVTGGRALMMNQLHPLSVFAVSRAVLPAFLFAGLLWLSAFRAFPLIEGFWFRHEKFLRLDTSSPEAVAYNYDLARQMRKELREMLSASASE